MDERRPTANAARSGVATGSHTFLAEQSKFDNTLHINSLGNETEEYKVDEFDPVSGKSEGDDPLRKFLPPPPVIEDPEKLQKLQNMINDYLSRKETGESLNKELRNRKNCKNPDFLQHVVRYQDIDQTGTCFNKDVFDPHGYDESDFYDEIVYP